MAKTLIGTEPRIGQIVYEPFAPTIVGIVVKVERAGSLTYNGSPRYTLDIRWFKRGKLGAPTKHDSWHLNDYEALAADHERKAVKFRNVINTIKSAVEKE